MHHGVGRRAPLAELLDDAARDRVDQACAFAPLHNPVGLSVVAITDRLLPAAVAIAVYDTGFHRTLPDHAALFGGPYSWFEQGLRRTGFHGINAAQATPAHRRDPRA